MPSLLFETKAQMPSRYFLKNLGKVGSVIAMSGPSREQNPGARKSGVVEKKEGPFWAPPWCCRDALRLYSSSSSTSPLENTMFSKVRFRLLLVKLGMMAPGNMVMSAPFFSLVTGMAAQVLRPSFSRQT